VTGIEVSSEYLSVKLQEYSQMCQRHSHQAIVFPQMEGSNPH